MTRKALLMILLSCGLGLFGSGCATVINGKTQKISITSQPSGAAAKVGGQTITTPGAVKLKRANLYTVVLSKDGYQTKRINIQQGISGWFFLNIPAGGCLFTPLLGVPDLLSGAAIRLVPGEINATLDSLPHGVTAASIAERLPQPLVKLSKPEELLQPYTNTQKARICIICPNFRGSLPLTVRILDGNDPIGVVTRKTFLCWERKPALVTIKIDDGYTTPEPREFKIEAGRTYYLLMATPQGPLQVLDEKQAKIALGECSSIEPTDYVPLR